MTYTKVYCPELNTNIYYRKEEFKVNEFNLELDFQPTFYLNVGTLNVGNINRNMDAVANHFNLNKFQRHNCDVVGDIPYNDESFDLITILAVFANTRVEKIDNINEVIRVLHPKGVIVSDFNLSKFNGTDKLVLCGDKNHFVYKKNIPILPPQKLFRILGDDFPREKYYRRTGEIKNFIHWGQRKLLLGEIEFLLDCLNLNIKKPKRCGRSNVIDHAVRVLYVGSAPGTHLLFLLKYFPMFHYILWDPREFDARLKKYKNVEIHQEYFTDDTDVSCDIFISDIRTANIENMTPEEVEASVVGDQDAQLRWYKKLNPHKSMLKFRLPWNDGKTEYLDGDVYFQCYAPLSSTETRLIVGRDAGMKIYDNRQYEEQLFYFNKYSREYKYDVEYPMGIPENYDTAVEVMILSKMIEVFGSYDLKDHYSEDFPGKSTNGPHKVLGLENNVLALSDEINKLLSPHRTLVGDQPLNAEKKKVFLQAIKDGLVPDIEPTVGNYNTYLRPLKL